MRLSALLSGRNEGKEGAIFASGFWALDSYGDGPV